MSRETFDEIDRLLVTLNSDSFLEKELKKLVKQKLSILPDRDRSETKTELTLEDRRAFLRKPLA